jgi:hypothetical protein
MRLWKFLAFCLVLLPLVVGAETISWILPTTYVDGTTISAADKARITIYLRGWKAGNPGAKTYFGETRNGLITWNDNVMLRMNYWGASNNVLGWVNIVPGDNVLVTASAAITWPDANGVMKEFDGAESAPFAWTIYKTPVTPPPPPPPPPTPSCNAPSGLTITK